MVKDENGAWKNVGGALNGYQWLATNVTSKSCLERAAALKEALGADFAEMGMELSKGSGQAIVLWAHRIEKDKAGAAVQLHQPFDKGKSHVEESQKSPFVVKIDKEGNMTGSISSAGWLYLSYVFGAKGEYKKALEYLKRSQESRAESVADRRSLELVAGYFKENNPTTQEGIGVN